MKKITITKGLPASGKTQWTNQQLDKYPGRYKNICKDDLRKMFDNSHWSKGNEKFVLAMRDALVFKALEEGYHVIISDTNLHEKHEKRIRELARMYTNATKQDIQIEIKYFDITPEEAIERDLKRPNSVGAKVIWDMYNTYVKEKKSEKVRNILEQDKTLSHAIICDLDGTLAIHNGRGPFEYDKCDTDLVNEAIARIIYDYTKSPVNGNNIIFMSGREDSCKTKTLNWIQDNTRITDFKLYMRKTGDFRKDSIIKKEIFDTYIKDQYYIDFILDDRDQVVKMWRDMGLTCLQVAEGNF